MATFTFFGGLKLFVFENSEQLLGKSMLVCNVNINNNNVL